MSIQAFTASSVTEELDNIADWWMTHAPDHEFGGFFGEITSEGQVHQQANKGVVLNSRILWFFSELARKTGDEQHVKMARRAYEYLCRFFHDAEQGGVIWEIDYKGQVVNAKKQTYAQCFCIYALSAYFTLSGDKEALMLATSYFERVEKHARDLEFGGYIEAFTDNWRSIDDYRLSHKDLDVPKSMNTHLHVLEAYAAFHKVAPSERTREALFSIIEVFCDKICDDETGHLKLFFDRDWSDRSLCYSYGHEIEASWLLWEALEILDDTELTKKRKSLVLRLAKICLYESIGKRGQVCDDFHFDSLKRNEASCWWVQAEALVGFLNAYNISGEQAYADVCDGIWDFIQQYHIDREHGEWLWVASCDTHKCPQEYKAGFWKAPYHNGRAMMELGRLFNEIATN